MSAEDAAGMRAGEMRLRIEDSVLCPVVVAVINGLDVCEVSVSRAWGMIPDPEETLRSRLRPRYVSCWKMRRMWTTSSPARGTRK